MTRAFEHDEVASGLFGHCLAARDGRDRVPIAVDHEYGTPHATGERARLLGGQPGPILRGDERLSVRLETPADAVLDRLRRVWLGEDLRDEELDEVAVIAKPVVAVVLGPALVRVVLRVEVREDGSLGKQVAPAGVRRPNEDCALDPLGMLRSEQQTALAAE